MTNAPIYLHGKVVMRVINGVAIRHAKPDEMLQKPRGWSFHTEVLQQLEAAHVCHLRVECGGRIYTVPWVTFAALSAPLDRGRGRQRFLPLSYWSIDGRSPERGVTTPREVRQLTLFNS
jgi:hypothetical protein